MAKAWNDTHDVKVELQYIPNNDYMDGTKLPTAFASGEGPDLFIISPGDFLRYYNGGVLLDLTPFIEAKAQADFPEGVIANRKVDGKIYGIPMEVEPMAMYYSVAAFEEAGLTEKDIPKTWDDLLAVGKKLTNDKRYGVLFETAPGYYQNFTWYPFMWQGGGEFQGADGKSAFNSPGVIQALKFWQDAVNQGVSPRKPLGGGGWDVVPNLGSGYCAIQNVGIWAISDLNANAKGFKYGIFKLPTPASGKYVTVGGGWAFVANSKGKNPEAAGQFCAWALGSMAPDSIQRVVDWCTKAKSDMPPRQSALEQGKAAFNEGFLKSLLERHLSRHAGRTTSAAAGLQDHLRRDPGLPAKRTRPGGRGGRCLRPARRLPCGLFGSADTVVTSTAVRLIAVSRMACGAAITSDVTTSPRRFLVCP